MTLRDDERGLSLGIVVFIAMLVIAALLYMMMNTAMVDVFAFSTDRASSPGARDQITMAQAIWNNLLYVAVFLALLFLISRAVREGALR